jgi:16S rRNA (adenine1518-N6/adenine1519-N6)-dimethyltransferase
MKLSEMRGVLTRRDIHLTKSLGQNFLHDANQLQKIVEAAELSKADKVLEIGPGLGPLTELLLENAGEVLAIEMDRRLVEILRERFVSAKNLKLIHDDALAFLRRGQPVVGQASSLFSSASEEKSSTTGKMPVPHDWSDWKLVANLPYSVASPILVELAAGPRAPKMIVATLQMEVARRLMAQADDDDYGILTLLVQLDFEPRGSFKIPPECFFPSPDVDSACVCLVRRATPLLPENLRPAFVKIVKRGFSQRRKMMLKLLKQDWAVDKLAAAFAELKISPQERAEKLSLEQFVKLTKSLSGLE